ncbi:MAG: crossover junction endodeoxyribonuclease RuvC [Planctomycetota bacterium]|jgi:crossover junction endodeoxyribonuclease RuvC
MRVLGVDPGLRITGYAVVEFTEGSFDPKLVEAGAIKLRERDPVADRLVELETDLAGIIDSLKPDHCCVEKLFAHYKRPVTAAIMGHGRGVVLLCARRAGLTINELNATEIKKAMTGNGHASKQQVALSVTAQLGLGEPPSPVDVTDALAIAMTDGRRMMVEAGATA